MTNFYYRTPMTHTMPFWLRRIFLHMLPRLLGMESPKLRENRLEYELALAGNADQSVVFENPYRTLIETTLDNRKIRSKLIVRVINSIYLVLMFNDKVSMDWI